MEYELYISEDGDIEMVYADDLAGLFIGEESDALTTRASHVEPHPMHTGFGWIVDMRPSAGRIFGANGVEVGTLSPPDIDRVVGFATRQAALEAEVAWLRAALEAGRLRSES